jgi:hypothetical protein
MHELFCDNPSEQENVNKITLFVLFLMLAKSAIIAPSQSLSGADAKLGQTLWKHLKQYNK